ncbi:CDP-glycerol glycerophosphotransferase family protein [Candidatus Saccharibacteria bacterium]|nr:CDP-glycerol glycerophosphotransferase family protein [Candidatus Saccharibacteria bacterium]
MSLIASAFRKKFQRLNNDLILFTSFNGKYADSPKVLSEAIHRLAPNKRLVWLVNDVDNKSIPDYVKRIKYGSNEADRYYGRAAAIIDNVYCGHEYYTQGKSITSQLKYWIGVFLKHKRRQKYYSTWHGSLIKKIGSDSNRNNSFNFSCSNTVMFLDNEFTMSVMKRITKGAINIKLMGEPRNDVLFTKNHNKTALKKALRIPLEKKAVIYAPTFRSNDDETKNIEDSGIKQMNELDIDKLLRTFSVRFGGDWVFVARFHYHVERAIDWGKIEKKYNGRVINGNKSDDIVDYLVCCDALITDISSCIYDFSMTDKPAFSYFPDYDHYANDERGLYFKKEELPWDVSTTADGLYASIEKFNQGAYMERVARFYSRLGFLSRKPCADGIAKFILNDLEER